MRQFLLFSDISGARKEEEIVTLHKTRLQNFITNIQKYYYPDEPRSSGRNGFIESNTVQKIEPKGIPSSDEE